MKNFTIFGLPYRLVALSGQREAITRWQFIFNRIILIANIMEEESWKEQVNEIYSGWITKLQLSGKNLNDLLPIAIRAVGIYFGIYEEWEDVRNCKRAYQVSNFGRVKSLSKNPFILRYRDNGNGYKMVGLSKSDKPKNNYVHTLVAVTFIPNPLNYPQINHKDGKKYNNFKLNLEWCSQSQNNIHAYKIGLRHPTGACTPGNISPNRKGVYKLSLTGKILDEYNSICDAASTNNIPPAWISRVCNGKNYVVHGFTYKFKT